MYCDKCGSYIPDGMEYCSTCGQPVGRAAYHHSGGAVAAKNHTPVIVGIIIAVALVLVAGIIAFTVMSHDRQEAQIAQLQKETAEAKADSEKADREGSSASPSTTTSGSAASSGSAQTASTGNGSSGTQDTPSVHESTTVNNVNNYYYYGTDHVSGTYYSSVTSSGYLWPTDTTYISYSDLNGYDSDTVAAIRNEIYARHGYAFQTTRWRNYFNNKSWYHRDPGCTMDVARTRMNAIEKANVDTIVAYEEAHGWR